MKTLRILTVALFATLMVGSVAAQSASIPNILNLRSIKNRGPIYESDKLVGYFVFYFKEKEDRKTSTYEIEVFDDNYNSVKSFELTRPKNTALLQSVYNGKNFLFTFYDAKTGYEYVTYDKSGEEVASTEIALKGMKMMERAYQATAKFQSYGKEGFIQVNQGKMVCYNNDLEEQWTYEVPTETKKEVNTLSPIYVGTDFIVTSNYRKKSAMTKKIDMEFMLIDGKDGSLIKELQLGSAETGKQNIVRADLDEVNKKIIIVGEYFKPKDDFLKDKGIGLYVMELDYEGEELALEKYAWEGDIDEFKNELLSEDDKKEDKKSYTVFFHDMIRSANGHKFLIGEQFKKQISVGATAGKLLVAAAGGTSNVSNFEVRVGNMVVFEFDENNKLVDYKIIEKKKRSVLLPEGAGFYGTAFLGYFVKSAGEFDYSFTFRDKEKDAFTVVYTDANRKEEKDDKMKDKAETMLGVIQIDGGMLEASRVPLNTEAKYWWIGPAKVGNISITEYYKKEKTLEMRLEPLTY